MRWNLRLAAANRGIWTASELQRMLADRGLVISAGKMSGLWSGQPQSIKLSDLEVLCAVLNASPEELLVREPASVPAAVAPETRQAADQVGAAGANVSSVRPRRRGQRSLPPAP